MDEGGLHIDVLSITPVSMSMSMTMLRVPVCSTVTVAVLVEAGAHDDVDQDAQPRGDQHHFGVYLELHADDPEHGHVDQDPGDHPDHQHGEYGSQHLRPMPAEGHPLAAGPARHPDGEQRDHEAQRGLTNGTL